MLFVKNCPYPTQTNSNVYVMHTAAKSRLYAFGSAKFGEISVECLARFNLVDCLNSAKVCRSSELPYLVLTCMPTVYQI